jgi:WGR domain
VTAGLITLDRCLEAPAPTKGPAPQSGAFLMAFNSGRIGTNGQELVQVFATEIEAGEALEAITRVKRQGYRDL